MRNWLGAVRKERANVLLARSAEDCSSRSVPRGHPKSRKSRRSGTGDERGRQSGEFTTHLTILERPIVNELGELLEAFDAKNVGAAKRGREEI